MVIRSVFMGNSNYLDVQNFQCKYKSLSLAWPACLPSEVMQPVPSFSLWDSLKAGKIRLASVINKHLWYFKGRAGRCMRMRQRQPEQAGQKQKQKDTKPWNEGGKADKATELGCICCVSAAWHSAASCISVFNYPPGFLKWWNMESQIWH